MSDVLKQIEELSDKAAKYEHMKDRYIDAAKKLEDAEALIWQARTLLDPVKSVNKGVARRGVERRTKYTEYVEEQYNKLKTGAYINTDTLEKDYPDLGHSQMMRLYMILSKSLGVHIRQKPEGRGKELYLLREG